MLDGDASMEFLGLRIDIHADHGGRIHLRYGTKTGASFSNNGKRRNQPAPPSAAASIAPAVETAVTETLLPITADMVHVTSIALGMFLWRW